MALSPDTLDIALLRSDRNRFIVACQPIIHIIVKKFAAKGMIESDLVEDTVQSVNERLIGRLDGIEKNFDGSVLLTTYLSVVIRNICLTLFESERRQSRHVRLTESDHLVEGESEYHLYIQDEVKRLSVILHLYDRKYPKILLCLKVYYRLPLRQHEIEQCFQQIDTHQNTLLSEKLGGDYSNSYESENFNLLSSAFRTAEEKNTSGDSLRKWTERKIHDIITLLNGEPPTKSYSPGTLKLLFEHYAEQ